MKLVPFSTTKYHKISLDLLTLSWLGFFMYVKWLGGGKITSLSKIFKKYAMKLKFTPQLRNHKKFQKKSNKFFLTQNFR